MRWVEHVARMRAIRNAYKILVGRSEGKRPLEDLAVGEGKVIPGINLPPRHEDVLGVWRYSSTHS